MPPCMSIHPSVHLCSPTYHYVLHMSWGPGEHLYTPYVMESFGGHVYIGASVRHFCVSISICPSVHNGHTSCPPIMVGCLFTGLDVYGCMLCFMFLNCSFLLVFSLCLKLLLPCYYSCDLCAPVGHLSSQLLPWPPP